MPIEIFLGLLLLIGTAVFLCVVLVFRLANHNWTIWEDD